MHPMVRHRRAGHNPFARREDRPSGTWTTPEAMWTACPATVVLVGRPCSTVTVPYSSDGRPISTPWVTSNEDSPSGASPETASHTAKAPAADPVAASSATPMSPANIRARAVRRAGSQATT